MDTKFEGTALGIEARLVWLQRVTKPALTAQTPTEVGDSTLGVYSFAQGAANIILQSSPTLFQIHSGNFTNLS